MAENPLLTQPVMQIVVARVLLFDSVEHQVGIAYIEVPM